MADFGSDYARGITPTTQAITYSAGASMGGLLSMAVFRGTDIPAGIFNNCFFASRKGNTGAVTIYVFDSNPVNSTITDATALVISSLDVGKLAFNPFTITPTVPQNAGAAMGESSPVRSVSNHDSPPTVFLYATIVANVAISCTVGDLFFRISMSQD